MAVAIANVARWSHSRIAATLFFTIGLMGLTVDRARALGALDHPSIEESVAGTRGILLGTFALTHSGPDHPGVLVELSEVQSYGIPGLHTSGIRVGGRRGAVALVGEAAQLSSDIGSESRWSLTTVLYGGDRWAASVGWVHEGATLDGFAGAHLASLVARSFVRLTNSVTVGGEVGRVRLLGETWDGADMTVVTSIRPVPGATIYGVLEFDRWTGLRPSISTLFTAYGSLRLRFGYEGVTDALKGALAIERAGFVVAAGATYHPVLGARRGISVSWRR